MTRVRFLARLLVLCGVAAIVIAGARDARAAAPRVLVLPTTGVVDQVMAGYLAEGVARAAREGASAVVIQLNTPGGSLDATQKIVSTLLEAPVPTIVWVAPAGGRAASAGTFITLAAHVALMAPGTNIGAASPVGAQGEDIAGTLGDKVKNDAIANIRSIAEARGRNVEWAISTVEKAASYPASEAVAAGAVDGLAGSLAEVFAVADGRTVTIGGQPRTLELTDASPLVVEMNPLQTLLHLLSDPNIAFILFTIGLYGLLFELQNPNFVTGILGALAIILALIGFGSLPLNVGGLLLIGLGIVLLVLEATVTSHGLLTIGGIVCFLLGASALYTEPGPIGPQVGIDWPVLAVMTAASGAFGLMVLYAAITTRRMKLVAAGPGGYFAGPQLEAVGEVRRALGPTGTVYIAGEEWSARTATGATVGRGEAIRVVGQEGLTLLVEPVEPQPT